MSPYRRKTGSHMGPKNVRSKNVCKLPFHVWFCSKSQCWMAVLQNPINRAVEQCVSKRISESSQRSCSCVILMNTRKCQIWKQKHKILWFCVKFPPNFLEIPHLFTLNLQSKTGFRHQNHWFSRKQIQFRLIFVVFPNTASIFSVCRCGPWAAQTSFRSPHL